MSFKEYVESYIECAKSRKVVIFIYTWPTLVCFFIASRGLPLPIEALKLTAAVTLVGYGVYFYNDIYDLQDDIKNWEMGNLLKASRPLSSGKISEDLLAKFAVLSAALGLLVAYTIRVEVLLLQAAYLMLGFLYSTEPIRLKKRFLCKQLTISVGLVLANLSGAFAGGGITPPVLYIVAMNFSLALGVNPLVDLPDLQGDRVMGVKSIPSVLGPVMTVRFAIAVLAAIAAASVMGYAQLGFNMAMPILVTIIITALIYVTLPLLRRWDEAQFANVVLFKKMVPLYLILQIVPAIGILAF